MPQPHPSRARRLAPPRRRWWGTTAALALVLTGCAAPQGEAPSASSSAPSASASPTSDAAPGASASADASPSAAPTSGDAVDTARSNPDVPMRAFAADERPPQFVLFSFDGGEQNERWKSFLAAAEDSDAHFTVFQSGVNLLTDANRMKYTAPGNKPGHVTTALGGDEAEVAERIGHINDAYARGHEIGTHANGHLCATEEHGGDKWTTAEWKTELTNFQRLFSDPRGVNGFGSDFPEMEVPIDAIQGTRLPCLEGKWSQVMPAWKEFGIRYDTSQNTGHGIGWPYQRDGIWEFEMPVVYAPTLAELDSGQTKVMAMDYNIWLAGNAHHKPEDDTEWLGALQLDTYRYMFESAYHGNRAPLVFGNHFSDWAGNAFNPAQEKAMREMCTREDTYCITYQQMVDWIEMQDPAVLEKWRAQERSGMGTDVDTLSWRP